MPRLFHLLHALREKYYCFLGHYFPKTLVKVWYKHLYGTDIDLINPKNIDEKINWLKFHGDIALWTRCADKYEVRKFVEEKGLGHTLNDLYGVYDTVDEIDFDILPKQFVIKATNGGGKKSVLIVENKDALDVKKTRKELNRWLKINPSYRYFEPQYKNIRPRLIIEKYLCPNAGEKSLLDYKMFCCNGKPEYTMLCSNRMENHIVSFSIYDDKWNLHHEYVDKKYATDIVYPKPANFQTMIEYSKILSEGMPFVRVDWYEVDGKLIFGELTFTPFSGFMLALINGFREILGDKTNLNI